MAGKELLRPANQHRDKGSHQNAANLPQLRSTLDDLAGGSRTRLVRSRQVRVGEIQHAPTRVPVPLLPHTTLVNIAHSCLGFTLAEGKCPSQSKMNVRFGTLFRLCFLKRRRGAAGSAKKHWKRGGDLRRTGANVRQSNGSTPSLLHLGNAAARAGGRLFDDECASLGGR